MIWIWTAVNSVLLLLLGAALLLMIRQVGLILQRVGPVGARGMAMGPRIGEDVSGFLGGRLVKGRPALVILGSSACPICSVIEEAARVVAGPWASRADVWMIYDEAPDRAAASRASALKVAEDAVLRTKLDVSSVPYGVMVDGEGLVIGQGLVNEASHLESLLEQLDRSRSRLGSQMERALV